MNAPLIVALPGNAGFAARLAACLGAQIAELELRRFPDGETYLRIDTAPAGRRVILVATLDRPDAKFLPLAFAALTLRDLGAMNVGLVAPYLAYMRQDRRFHAGEAVTSRIFAGLISQLADWLVTVDPHLHRIADLKDIYSIPASTLHAAPLIARWITENVDAPLIVGPDAESVQWVAGVTQGEELPSLVLKKTRRGDREVVVSVPDIAGARDRTPVLIDDIISTGTTMIESLSALRRAGAKPAICIGVHAVFAEGAYEALRATGLARIITTNTIAHETNAIDLAPLIAQRVLAIT